MFPKSAGFIVFLFSFVLLAAYIRNQRARVNADYAKLIADPEFLAEAKNAIGMWNTSADPNWKRSPKRQ